MSANRPTETRGGLLDGMEGVPPEHRRALQEEQLMKLAGFAYEDWIKQQAEAYSGPGMPYQAGDEAVERVAGQIQARITAEQQRRRLARCGKRAAAAFASAAALVALMVPVSFATVDASRTALANYVIHNFGQYSVLVDESSGQTSAPFGWRSEYYPTWVPEGFSFNHLVFKEQFDSIWYSDSYGNSWSFSIFNDNQLPQFDSEEMISTTIPVKSKEGILYISSDRRKLSLIIKIDNQWVVVTGNLTRENILKIAESIQLL